MVDPVAARRGRAVAFLGNGVNDALAVHAADVGLPVDPAAVAKGAAEGRRILATTIKYVLMGPSSNFGNMCSAAAAAAVLPLPDPAQRVALRRQPARIPTDRADTRAAARAVALRPAHDPAVHAVLRPGCSSFDFLTFGVMLGPFHAGPGLFRSGWFVESLATQTLVIFAIRTRRMPFLRSRPSMPLLGTALAVVAVGTALPLSPLATVLGFRALPIRLVVTLGGLVGRDLPGPGRAGQAVVLRRAAQSATHCA